MIKKLLKNIKTKKQGRSASEFAEITDLINLMSVRIEKNIETLRTIEASVDKKLEMLERFTKQVESLKTPSNDINRNREIVAFMQKGMKIDEIADYFGISQGEVEFILNFHMQQSSAPPRREII